MKATFFCICLVLNSLVAFSQITWNDFVVYDSDQDSTASIFFFEHVAAGDLNNDGYDDIIAAAIRKREGLSTYYRSVLVWFKNIGGTLNFSEPIIIFEEEGQKDLPFIDVGDIDNDNDIDIVYSTSQTNSTIIWLENQNVDSVFTEHYVTNMFHENCAVLKDLDNDGDLDLLTSGTRHTEYYKNVDGLGDFVREERFYEYFDGSRHQIAGEDFDNDGDYDVMYWRGNGGSWATDDMYIHYNQDNLGFGPAQLLTSDNPQEIRDIELIDVDQDGEKDIVFCIQYSSIAGDILWQKVSDGMVINFGGILASPLNYAMFMDKVDIDNDGDMDIISSAPNNSLQAVNPTQPGEYILLFNEGQSQFSEPIRIPLDEGRLPKVIATDLNNDNVIEIVGAAYGGIFGLQFDNIPTNTQGAMSKNTDFEIFPNPTSNELHISTDISTGYIVKIFNLHGELVYTDKNQQTISLNDIPNGYYQIVLIDNNTYKTQVEKLLVLK